jgi:hypothetical protein
METKNLAEGQKKQQHTPWEYTQLFLRFFVAGDRLLRVIINFTFVFMTSKTGSRKSRKSMPYGITALCNSRPLGFLSRLRSFGMTRWLWIRVEARYVEPPGGVCPAPTGCGHNQKLDSSPAPQVQNDNNVISPVCSWRPAPKPCRQCLRAYRACRGSGRNDCRRAEPSSRYRPSS